MLKISTPLFIFVLMLGAKALAQQHDVTSLQSAHPETHPDSIGKNFSSYKRSFSIAGVLQTRYVASLTGEVDVNGKHFDPDKTKGITNTFMVKRARVMFKANINDHFSANVLVNFADFNSSNTSGKVLENAYIKYTLNKHFNVQGGQFRPFYGIEDALPVDIVRTLDFSNQYYAFGRNGWQSFQIGLSVFGSVTKDDKLRYFVGAYNGNNKNQLTDDNNEKNFYGRLEFQPLKQLVIAGNGAFGSLGESGTGSSWGGDATTRINLSKKWKLLIMAEYKNGSNFTAYNADVAPGKPGLDQYRMEGFYFFPTLRFEYKKPRVRAIELSARYEYLNELYRRDSNPHQTLIPNVSLIFADDFFAAIQMGVSMDWNKKDIPLSTTYTRKLAYVQLQIRI
ncbi:porin [Dyadobacter jiangsuensis]|uniref:Phosphate-selective porin O/P n=1 Tax=Dyadobacter jiangsuensis TaxID=1591085 RepID=A0A2P8FQA1_9BACT|nr:porin [Dyadobacter jiangsuensis]PSL23835.1 phosphate-selective porin O/P [Dyadobacter jiangsuensis]